MPAEIGERGCGAKRQPGGMYLEVSLSEHGKPLAFFLCDPAIVLTREQVNAIPRVGMQLVNDGTHTHVLDWVGETHYPYVTDFLEEGRRMGFSRRLNQLVDVSALGPGSLIYFVHSRAALANWREWHGHQYLTGLDQLCPRLGVSGDRVHLGPDVTEQCVRHLWAAPPHDRQDDLPGGGGGSVWTRRFVNFEYRVFPPAKALASPWMPAIIARFPITNLTIISADDGSHERLLKRVRERSRLPVYEEVA